LPQPPTLCDCRLLVFVGGWHLGLSHVDEALSIRIVREAIDVSGTADEHGAPVQIPVIK
jgi:hypothetical protein